MSDRLTLAAVVAEPWKYEAAHYAIATGTHQPHIAEISPYQYARLSKVAKRRYDAKRAAEWEAITDCKDEWRALVWASFGQLAWALDDPSATGEARSVVWQRRRAEDLAEQQRRVDEAMAANRITSAAELEPGQRVFSVLCGTYATVHRCHKVSVRVVIGDDGPAYLRGKAMTVNVGTLQRQSYGDVCAGLGIDPQPNHR